MSVPDFQSLMHPLLEEHLDGKEHLNQDLIKKLADRYRLTEAELRERLPSGRAKLFDNRVGWAKSHLTQAGLLDSPKRAVTVITQRGLKVLKDHPTRVDLGVLNEFEDYREFRTRKKPIAKDHTNSKEGSEEQTPEEQLENAYLQARRQIEADLLQQIMENPPDFLERVVVDLIVSMGYGGSRKDAGEALGRTGDEGIDGLIKEDPLGLDIIYLQAKRWEGTVGRPEIQKFAGALQGQRAKKGIFITTSSFTSDSRDYVAKIETKIILIDGQNLAKLMFDHGIGVTTTATYEIRNIDSDYFAQI